MKLLRGWRDRLRGRHTVRAHLWQSLANYTQQGFGLLLSLILARLLQPEDFGAFGFAAASVLLALLPATWSLAPTLIMDAAAAPAFYATAAAFGWCVVFVRLAIVAGLVTWFYLSGQHQTALLCLLCGIIESWKEPNTVQRAYLEGQGNFKPNLISALLGVVFCLGVVVPVAFFLHWGPFTLVLPGLGIACMDFFLYRHFSGRSVFVKPTWNVGGDAFRKGFWIWLICSSEVALARLDSWFIGKFRGDTALGYYNRAFGYAPISHMLLSSFLGNASVVGFARCESGAKRRRLFFRTASIVLVGGALNWAVFFFFARPVVLFALGPKWEGAVPVFQAFAGLSLAYMFALLPYALLLSARRYREIALVRVCCVALFAAALFVVPGARSAVAVAWLVQATLLVQGLVLLFRCRSLLVDRSASRDADAGHLIP